MDWLAATSISGNRTVLPTSRRHRSIGLAVALVAASAPVVTAQAAANAPKSLYGKSIVVSWTESRSQRPLGDQGPFRPVSVNLQRSIYISSAGRLFSRLESTANVGRRSMSGKAEGVGAAGTNFSGGPRNIQFKGNSLVMITGFQASARRLVVDFDGSFQTCTAQVITAKQVGEKAGIWRGVAGRMMLEVESVSAGAATCSIRTGNVFAE